jgi:hypothetical protein
LALGNSVWSLADERRGAEHRGHARAAAGAFGAGTARHSRDGGRFLRWRGARHPQRDHAARRLRAANYDRVYDFQNNDRTAQYFVGLTGKKPLKFVAGSTGVQTPQLIPYYPNQMAGILGAIKGAAEYEYLVNQAVLKADPGAVVPPRFQEAQRRMAPQLFGHVLMVLLIVLGNLVFVGLRPREARA